jgi:hypothetical protein
MTSFADEIAPHTKRVRRSLAGFVVFLLLVFAVGTIFTHHTGGDQLTVGRVVPPFAVPLALSELNGDANIATHANDGEAGIRPACSVRGATILNLCQLYEQRPVVLALFIDNGACANILGTLKQAAAAFPDVNFAAVAIRGDRVALRILVRSRAAGLPVGYDEDGALASLYAMVSCPQITFIEPGGRMSQQPLRGTSSTAALNHRVSKLLAAARAHGWVAKTTAG